MFRDKLVGDYRDFTRSFIQPKAEDISSFLDSEYDGGQGFTRIFADARGSFLNREEKYGKARDNPGFITSSKTGRGIARGLCEKYTRARGYTQ